MKFFTVSETGSAAALGAQTKQTTSKRLAVKRLRFLRGQARVL